MPQAPSRLGRKLSISLFSLIVAVGGLKLVCRVAGYAPKDDLRSESDPLCRLISIPDRHNWLGRTTPGRGVRLLPVRIKRCSQGRPGGLDRLGLLPAPT